MFRNTTLAIMEKWMKSFSVLFILVKVETWRATKHSAGGRKQYMQRNVGYHGVFREYK